MFNQLLFDCVDEELEGSDFTISYLNLQSGTYIEITCAHDITETYYHFGYDEFNVPELVDYMNDNVDTLYTLNKYKEVDELLHVALRKYKINSILTE